jgi:hypothetical protein
MAPPRPAAGRPVLPAAVRAGRRRAGPALQARHRSGHPQGITPPPPHPWDFPLRRRRRPLLPPFVR